MATNGTKEEQFVGAALKSWQTTVDRAGKLFLGLTTEGLEKEVAPGKNRLIYLFGHVLATSDAMYAMLRLGDRLHPDLDALFLRAPDKTADLTAADDLKAAWVTVHERLAEAMAKLTPAEWIERHASATEEDFAKEPHRNRFTILLGRTGHLAYHLGQAGLAK